MVEYEITTGETAPMFEGGSAWRISIQDVLPGQRVHLVVEAAAGVTLRTASQQIPEAALRRVEGKPGTRVECDWGPVARRK